MKKLVLFISLSFVLFSCDKKYTYIEVVNEKSLLGNSYNKKEREPEIIKAKNDTLAFIEAYSNFCISLKVCEDMKQRGSTMHSQPVAFKIINSDGIDITNIDFISKQSHVKSITDRIFSLELTSENDDTVSQVPKIDSTKVKELSKYFDIKKDEFSDENVKWYTPKSAPKYSNRNGIYCYIRTSNGTADVLRFVIQYYADDWLFFEQIKFSIDDSAYSYFPVNSKRDNGSGYIWEWFDDILSSENKDIILALSESKQAKMKFIGDKYYKIKDISRSQCEDIKRTVDLFIALGGSL